MHEQAQLHHIFYTNLKWMQTIIQQAPRKKNMCKPSNWLPPEAISSSDWLSRTILGTDWKWKGLSDVRVSNNSTSKAKVRWHDTQP